MTTTAIDTLIALIPRQHSALRLWLSCEHQLEERRPARRLSTTDALKLAPHPDFVIAMARAVGMGEELLERVEAAATFARMSAVDAARRPDTVMALKLVGALRGPDPDKPTPTLAAAQAARELIPLHAFVSAIEAHRARAEADAPPAADLALVRALAPTQPPPRRPGRPKKQQPGESRAAT